MLHKLIQIDTAGPACHDFTDQLIGWLRDNQVRDGVLTLLVRHTSCSLLIQENADPDVQADLLTWLDRVAPQADHPDMRWITHRCEGPDDMPAHLKSALLPTSLQIPVIDGRVVLGRWQGVYLVEHRRAPHQRQVAAAFMPG